jgi:hypothetical protein
LTAHASDLELLDALGRDAYLARSEALRDAVAEAKAEFDATAHRNAARLNQPVRQLRADWDDMDLAKKRELVGNLVQAVFVRNGPRNGKGPIDPHVRIIWFDDPPVDLPRQGRRDYIVRPFPFDDANPSDVREAVA